MSNVFPRPMSPEEIFREKIFSLILAMIGDLQAEITAQERQEEPDQPRLYYLQGQIDGLRWLWSHLGKEVRS